MLDLSADAASNIQFGADSDTGLANLAVMVGITGIDGSTAGAYLSMEFFAPKLGIDRYSSCFQAG